MKKILLSALFVSFVFSTFAQTPDTAYTTVVQTTESFEKTRFVDRYSQVFGTQSPAKVLFKWNALSLAPIVTYGEENQVIKSAPIVPSIDLRIEAKLAPMLSIQAAGTYYHTRQTSFNRGGYGTDIRIEPRWYYDMPGRIRSGKSANNLTGNYIGLEGRNFWYGSKLLKYESQALSLRFGMQRRLWRYGFFDLSYGVGYQSSEYRYISEGTVFQRYSQHSVYGEARVALGFALGGRKPAEAASSSVCDVLRCFQEDRHMFKLDLLRAVRFDQNVVKINPIFSYEQKIGQSQFAVELEGEIRLNRVQQFDTNQARHTWSFGAGASIQPRYYLLQKWQIARGKSGNNLNGPFIGYALGYLRTQYNAFDAHPGIAVNKLYNAPHLGVQYRLFHNGFIQYKLGVVWSDVKVSDFSFGEPAGLYSNLKIGVVF